MSTEITPAERAKVSQLLADGARASEDLAAELRQQVAELGEAETVVHLLDALTRMPPHRIADVAVAALMNLARTELPEPAVCPRCGRARCAWCSLPVDGSLPTNGAGQ